MAAAEGVCVCVCERERERGSNDALLLTQHAQ